MSARDWLDLAYAVLIVVTLLIPARRPWLTLLAGGGLAGVSLAARAMGFGLLSGCAGVVAGVAIVTSCITIRETERRDRAGSARGGDNPQA